MTLIYIYNLNENMAAAPSAAAAHGAAVMSQYGSRICNNGQYHQ